MTNKSGARQHAGLSCIRAEAYAKINWALFIRGTRSDGYHELDMLMQTISLSDTLVIEKSDSSQLIVNGEPSKDPESDLAVKAVRALSAFAGRPIGVKIDLTKRIPARAGLGGGSSDAANVLLAVKELYDIHISRTDMEDIALRLGADVPFFLTGGLCRVRGIGEKIEPIAPMQKRYLAIVRVGEGLGTKDVYGKYDEMHLPPSTLDMETCMRAFSAGDLKLLDEMELNDLKKPASALMPEIEETKKELRRLGSIFTRMSGSGSAVYGVFHTKEAAQAAAERMRCGIVCETKS